MFYLLDLERTIKFGTAHYWRKSQFGYTPNLEEAGLFSEVEAKENVENDYDKCTFMIPKETVDNILR